MEDRLQSPHMCPICSKQFTRRDLRDRHRRRCEKSIGKQRPTKKRACESCIASKVKCDHVKPACDRCITRSIQCEYKLDPQPAVRIPRSRAEPDVHARVSEPVTMSTEGIDNLFLELMNPIPDTDYTFRLHGHIPNGNHISSERTPDVWSDGAANLWHHPSHPRPHIEMPFSFGDATSMEQNWSFLPGPLPVDIQLQNSHTSGIPRTASISTNISNTGSHQLHRDSPQYSHNQSPAANALFQSRHSSYASSESSNQSSPAPLSPHSSPPPNPRPSNSLSGPLSLGYRSKSITKHSDSLSEVARAALSSHKPLPPGTISVEDAIKMISEYPTRMLVDTFQSPFVHPRLNRDSPRGMPEPIAVALACVGMKMHAEQSGLPFVCNIFCDQREKLLKELPSMCGKYEEITAALHAMCIYQIEGLLSENRYDSKLSPAVLHQEYLIRMTRRITKQLDRDAPQFFASAIASNLPWETWTIHESLRRVLFLLMIIHQLLGATKIVDPVYFEPLFSDHVSNRLLLPCHESLWNANTQAEWEEARKGLADGERRCLGEAVTRLNAHADGRDTPMIGASLERDDVLNYFEQLSEITKLTISVAQIKVKAL